MQQHEISNLWLFAWSPLPRQGKTVSNKKLFYKCLSETSIVHVWFREFLTHGKEQILYKRLVTCNITCPTSKAIM